MFGPDGCAEPAQIRRTLLTGPPAHVRGAGDHTRPLPGCCGSMRCRVSLVVNWCFPWFSEVSIPGCGQTLHTPHMGVGLVPCDNYSNCAIVYKLKRFVRQICCYVLRAVSRGGGELGTRCPIGASVSCAEDSLMCQWRELIQ